jgi:uncharacterized protein (DUF342 family)
MVAGGTMIAEITPPMAGTPGRNVLGKQFGEATDAVSLSVSPGDNVRQEETGERTYFYAEVEGRASVTDGVVHVRPVSYVENNLERPMEVAAGHEVHIRGSIRSGGSVSGEGGVIVEGMVEGGGRVEAKGDVVIGKGVVGRESRINSGGNVYCPFVQQASIVARGDVYIDGHLIGAQISAGGQLVIRGHGEERNGTAIGGRIVAARGIQARRLGGTRAETMVAIGPDPELAGQIRTVDNALKFIKVNVLRIFRTLGINDVDATHFKRLIDTAPAHQRQPVMALLAKLKALIKAREQSMQKRKILEKGQDELYKLAEIRIRSASSRTGSASSPRRSRPSSSRPTSTTGR